ncbi:MAG TPA: hypothetical protein VI911_07565 [Patescibacteria group bacterium]|nr:hypothetical protein [Patescibacteria group bacterium]
MDGHNIMLTHLAWFQHRAEALGYLWKTTCIHCLKEITNGEEVCIIDHITYQVMFHKECVMKKMFDAAKLETNDGTTINADQ